MLIYLFAALLFVLIAGFTVAYTARQVCAYLTQRDEREQTERAHLLNRIQAPSLAVAHSVSQMDEERPIPYVAFDDDEDFHLAQQERISELHPFRQNGGQP